MIGVVGGGIAGLAAAYRLQQRGYEARVFEASDDVGGLAATYGTDGDRIEKFYHHLSKSEETIVELADELGVGDAVEWRVGENAYYVDGVVHPLDTPWEIAAYPHLSLYDKFRLGMLTLGVDVRGAVPRRDTYEDLADFEDVPIREFVVEHTTESVYENFFEPLLDAKFGSRKDDVSAAWLLGRIKFRGERDLLRGEILGYFEGGFHRLIDALIDAVGRENVVTGARVTDVGVREGAVETLTVQRRAADVAPEDGAGTPADAGAGADARDDTGADSRDRDDTGADSGDDTESRDRDDSGTDSRNDTDTETATLPEGWEPPDVETDGGPVPDGGTATGNGTAATAGDAEDDGDSEDDEGGPETVRRTHDVDAVVVAAMPNVLEALTGYTCEIDFQGTVCSVVSMDEPLTDTYWLNVKDDAPFGALIEHTNFVPPERYGGEHLLYVAKYVQDPSESVWRMDDDEVEETWIEGIEDLFPDFDRSSIDWVRTARNPRTAPVYERGYLDTVIPYDLGEVADGLYYAGMASRAQYPERSLNGGVVAGFECADRIAGRK